jgi:hypothetical protein
MPGYVYQITNKRTGARYIGCTMQTVAQRQHGHLRDLMNGTHHCQAFQKAWNIGRRADFTIKTLSTHGDVGATYQAEQQAYDEAKAAGAKLYNSVRPHGTASPLLAWLADLTRARRAARRGRPRVIVVGSTAAEWMSIQPGFKPSDIQEVHITHVGY